MRGYQHENKIRVHLSYKYLNHCVPDLTLRGYIYKHTSSSHLVGNKEIKTV